MHFAGFWFVMAFNDVSPLNSKVLYGSNRQVGLNLGGLSRLDQ